LGVGDQEKILKRGHIAVLLREHSYLKQVIDVPEICFANIGSITTYPFILK